MSSSVLDLSDVFTYVGDFKRPFVEGDAILKANHIVELGVLKNEVDLVEVMALCLQTSNINGQPHEINITIRGNGKKEIQGTCSCKAGTGKCKHVAAVCLQLCKMPVEELELLTCTDMKQQWGKLSRKGKDMYRAIPIKKFCHFPPLPSNCNLPELKDLPDWANAKLDDIILKGCPGSALSKHMEERN
ncbi:uncharacterized protein LOC124163281 [Ischnura elegans]|uniref:uncharacterized protein LOC124163281 n=1 Tax=Ischnura elegans TaxID=197161 RepID=UPI001ED867F2|nr:uncharacterized protein LOC124163281 [Ischnura elegans]